MFCNKCGSEIPSDSKFCVKCGTSAETEVQFVQHNTTAAASDNSKKVANKEAIAALIDGVLGILCCAGYVGIIFAIIAVWRSRRGKKIAEEIGYGEQMSTAGFVLGIAGIVLSVIIWSRFILSFS